MQANDVRKMSVCCVCGGLGTLDPKSSDSPLPALLVLERELFRGRMRPKCSAHASCLVEPDGSVRNILRLPLEEIAKVRMCDLNNAQFRRVFAGYQAQRRAAEAASGPAKKRGG